MIISNLTDDDYQSIWEAPEGNEYATQFRREGDREWSFTDIAITRKTAYEWFSSCVQQAAYGVEYRVVRLSRYPPCTVVQVISHYKESHG